MISVFKTNIEMPKDVLGVLSDLKNKLEISAGSIDTEDEDYVLRLEHYRILSIDEVTEMVRKLGFYCEELTD